MEALSSTFFGMGPESGPISGERINPYQRQMNNFGYHHARHPGAELMSFGFKPPEFMPWNVPHSAAYNPYSPSCSRVPGDNHVFDRLPPPPYGEESLGSHEVLSKDGSSDSAAESHHNGHVVSQHHHQQQQLQQPAQNNNAPSQALSDSSDDPNKKKRDRFKGMSEDEVLMRMLPDHLVPNLDIVIIGINHGLTAAYVGHHYAGPGNHFWKCLYMSGLIPEPMNCYDDYRLLHYGIGFTNIVARCTKGSADLTRKELKEGIEILTAKIQKYKPKIAVFNGKGIYEIFCGNKNFYVGKQPDPFPGTSSSTVFVMPSSSARCSQLPRAVDKVPFYVALRKLRDYRRGDLPHLDESEVTFPDLELKVEPRKDRLDRQLKQQQEAAAAAAVSRAGFDKKRRFDGDVEFDSVFPGMRSGYPPFHSNGLQGNSASWNSSSVPRWPGGVPPPSIGFQHAPTAAGGSSLVQRLGQVPTVDSVFGSVPQLLLKQEDSMAVGAPASTVAAAPQYGQFDPCNTSRSTSGYWPPAPSHNYGGTAAFTNYPYGFHQSLYGAPGNNVPSENQVQGSSRAPVPTSSFSYHEGSAAADLHNLSSNYPAMQAAAAAAAAYDSSSFFLSHSMSSGSLAGSSWPAAHQYMSSRSGAPYMDAFGREGFDSMSAMATSGGFDPRTS